MKYLSTITSLDFYLPLLKFLKNLDAFELIPIFDHINVPFQPNIWKAILNISISTSNRSHISFIKNLITLEVHKSSTASTLFRANSIASKILSVYISRVGSKYLYEILNEPILNILKDDKYIEVDNTKITQENYDIDSAQTDLIKITKSFLDNILNSVEIFPPEIKEITKHLRGQANIKYETNEVTMTAIAGLIILRFIGPVIVTPHLFQIIPKSPPSNTQRTLMLVSKILQQLANQVEFKKEKYMEFANKFLNEKLELQNEFFDKISTGEIIEKNDSVTDDELLWSSYQIHEHFNANIEKHLSELNANNYPIKDEDKLKENLIEIKDIIKKLGGPPKINFKVIF
jgi:hypothetical protein